MKFALVTLFAAVLCFSALADPEFLLEASSTQCSVDVNIILDTVTDISTETDTKKIPGKVAYLVNLAAQTLKECKAQLPLCGASFDKLIQQSIQTAKKLVSGSGVDIWRELEPSLNAVSQECIVDVTYYAAQLKKFVDSYQVIATTNSPADPTDCKAVFNQYVEDVAGFVLDIQSSEKLAVILQDIAILVDDSKTWSQHCHIALVKIQKKELLLQSAATDFQLNQDWAKCAEDVPRAVQALLVILQDAQATPQDIAKTIADLEAALPLIIAVASDCVPSGNGEQLLMAYESTTVTFEMGKCVSGLGEILKASAPIVQKIVENPGDVFHLFNEIMELYNSLSPAAKGCGIDWEGF